MKSAPISFCTIVAVVTMASRGFLCGRAGVFAQDQTVESAQTSATKTIHHSATTSDQYPPGELGDVVRLGETLVRQTHEHPLTKPFVGNKLNCTPCHLDTGTHSTAASFIGVAAAYPAWSPREKRVITLEDRILNCFIRSQNGKRPPHGGTASVAIASYLTWLSRDTPIAMNSSQPLGQNHLTMLNPGDRKPDIDRGGQLYPSKCADCHASDGSGTDDGPPVWGHDSYNNGAGLAQVPKLASWLKVAMPLDDATLSDNDAFDIAAFVNYNPRPVFQPTD